MKLYRSGLIVAILLAHCLLYSSACLAALINVEPDLFAHGTDISNNFPGVTLSVNGQPANPVLSGVGDGGCGSVCASTGTQVFRPSGIPQGHWQFGLAVFRADFANLTDFLSIDFAGIDNGDVKAEIYDLSGVLLDSFITYIGAEGINTTATFNRPTADIAYILAGGVPGESVLLDHLTFDAAAVPEPSTLGLIGLGLLGLSAMKRRRYS
jgi:PEP-CTERM motif